jgi:leucyl-tRNA synthetase
LKEWACSRLFGLGTKLPWDEQFVIESLSDSTVYFAYYTVNHLLHPNNLDGINTEPDAVKPEHMTHAVWDHIFLDKEKPADCQLNGDLLAEMKREFEYWYPMDLRCSAKDLIKNHLSFSLYNH